MTRTSATAVMKFVSPSSAAAVDVQVAGHAGAGRAPEVHPDVDAVGAVGGPDGPHPHRHPGPQLVVLGRVRSSSSPTSRYGITMRCPLP